MGFSRTDRQHMKDGWIQLKAWGVWLDFQPVDEGTLWGLHLPSFFFFVCVGSLLFRAVWLCDSASARWPRWQLAAQPWRSRRESRAAPSCRPAATRCWSPTTGACPCCWPCCCCCSSTPSCTCRLSLITTTRSESPSGGTVWLDRSFAAGSCWLVGLQVADGVEF